MLDVKEDIQGVETMQSQLQSRCYARVQCTFKTKIMGVRDKGPTVSDLSLGSIHFGEPAKFILLGGLPLALAGNGTTTMLV